MIGLAGIRGGAPSTLGGVPGNSVTRSPPVSASSRGSRPSPPRHRGSVSSTRSHASSPPLPPPLAETDKMKRPLSPASDKSSESKRARMEGLKRRGSSPSTGGRTPGAGRRSPIQYRGRGSPSPEERQPPLESNMSTYHTPGSPLAVVLPPHPRPIGAAGLSSSSHGASGSSSGSLSGGGNGNNVGPIALPPIATLSSPTSTAPSPPTHDERMNSRSSSPPSRSGGAKLSDVVHSSRSPPMVKGTPSPRSSVHAMETEQGS